MSDTREACEESRACRARGTHDVEACRMRVACGVREARLNRRELVGLWLTMVVKGLNN